MNYIFDIDGTLTPSRLPIDKDFEAYFLEWMEGKNVFFVTGSDKDKTIEQIGERIWKKATRCYQSCGNAVFENGKLISQLNFPMKPELEKLLTTMLEGSIWYGDYDVNIETRIGLINFSTIGRECPQHARDEYFEKENEREGFCEAIMTQFPELEASVGGQISIDIYPKGKNKAQVLDDIEGDVMFFGDRCEEGGNDYPIVQRLWKENNRKRTIHHVSDWKETFRILKSINEPAMAPNGNLINKI